jgi:hypothetical protein
VARGGETETAFDLRKSSFKVLREPQPAGTSTERSSAFFGKEGWHGSTMTRALKLTRRQRGRVGDELAVDSPVALKVVSDKHLLRKGHSGRIGPVGSQHACTRTW